MGRLSVVSISISEKGAAVMLDGEKVMSGPGKISRLILPGKHQLIAEKAQMLTYTKELMLEPGKKTAFEIDMVPLSEGVVMKRRWKTWKPWAIAGTGAGLAALGGVAYLLASSDFNTFEARVADRCPMGCLESELPKSVTRLETRAEAENIVSVSLFVAGGAVAATGIVMIFMNRPRPHQVEETPADKRSFTVVPVLGDKAAFVTSELRF